MTGQTAAVRVGVSCVDITPAVPFDLAGMNVNERADTVHTPLQAQVFVFEAGAEVAVLVTLDVLNIAAETVAELRGTVSKLFAGRRVGVMVACSHTHSAPYTTFFAGHGADRDYLGRLRRQVVDAVAQAFEGRRPAVVRQAEVTAAGLAANRRAVLAGEQVATHAAATAPGFVRFEGPVDDQLRIAWFIDEVGEVIGGLVNFACHPTLTGFDSCASADFPARLRTTLHDRYGGVFGFLQGASGDLSPDETFTADHRVGTEAADDFGRQLGERACDAIDRAEMPPSADAGRSVVAWASRTLTIGQRLATMELVEAARRYLAGQVPDSSPLPDTNRLLCGFDYTFWGNPVAVQRWFAYEMIGMWEWQQRATVAVPTEQVEVQVLRVDSLLVVGLPCELFTQLGLRIKATAAAPAPMISTLTNGYHGYVPTTDAFNRGGYETRLGYQSRLAPDTGPRLAAAAAELIAELASLRT